MIEVFLELLQIVCFATGAAVMLLGGINWVTEKSIGDRAKIFAKKISFNYFLTLFEKTQSFRWSLNNNYVEYMPLGGTSSDGYYRFGFVDTFRYQHWLNKRKKAQKNHHNEEILKMIEDEIGKNEGKI